MYLYNVLVKTKLPHPLTAVSLVDAPFLKISKMVQHPGLRLLRDDAILFRRSHVTNCTAFFGMVNGLAGLGSR